VCIDHDKCRVCRTMACVDACELHGVGILAILNGRPVLTVSLEEAKRRDTECLACELACDLRGNKAIVISLPIAGLQEYRDKHGNTAG
jgi:dissimilatory sulfite reductase (desulfoviridin) alpha/beta subunit